MIRRVMTNAAVIIALLAAAALYIRFFEDRHLYFPWRAISYTPLDAALRYEDIYFKTADGLKLNGWFIPSGRNSATILFLHGNGGNMCHRIDVIKMFNGMGLNVFIFDYRGYGRSQGRPSERGLYQDALAAYGCLVSRGDIDKDKIVIFGESIGAAIGMELCYKVKIRAIISDGAFTSVPDMAKKIYPYLPLKYVVRSRYDSLSKVRGIKIPKLFIHSRDDEIVPFSHSSRLFEAAPEPKEFLELRGGHNYAVFLESAAFTKGVENFLKKYGVISYEIAA